MAILIAFRRTFAPFLAGAAIADVTFVAFAGAVLVIAAFSALRVKAVFVVGFSVLFSGAVRIFVTFRVRRGATRS